MLVVRFKRNKTLGVVLFLANYQLSRQNRMTPSALAIKEPLFDTGMNTDQFQRRSILDGGNDR